MPEALGPELPPPRNAHRFRLPEPRRLLRLTLLGAGIVLLGLGLMYLIRAGALRSRVLGEFAALARNDYSHVVAAPATLRVGTDVRAQGLVSRLQRAGLARGGRELGPAQFRVEGQRVTFRRGRDEANGQEVRIDLDGAVIAAIHVQGETQSSVQLPVEHLTSFRTSLQERRTPVTYAEIPPGLIQAVLAAEDRRFFAHPGIDGRGIVRALWRNLQQHRVVEGGSTITQQMVKQLLRRRGRALGAKVDEAILALIVERHFSKRQILQVYLNEVYLGQDGPFGVVGVAEGARHLFGKPLGALSKREQIELAAAIRAPNAASPRHNPERLESYANAVERALEQVPPLPAATDSTRRAVKTEDAVPPGFLMPSQGEGDPIEFGKSQMAYFFDVLQREWDAARERYRIDGPATLVAGVDPLLQLRAAQALRNGLAEARKRMRGRDEIAARGGLQGAVVVLDPQSGALRAVVGGEDYVQAPFNRAVDIARPVGSTFKPFVFLAAMRGRTDEYPRITQSTWIPDELREYRVGRHIWRPANFDREYRGWITAREALSQSVNAATVALGMEVGVKNVARLAQDLGVAERVPANPSIFLGALDTSPLRLTCGYAPLANGGYAVAPHALLEVRRGEQRLQFVETEHRRVLDPQVAYVVTDMLVDALRTGTGRSSQDHGFQHLATGKTGTTDDTRDAWFVGYTPEIVTTVWVGHDDNRATDLTGARAALPIWAGLMRTWLGDGWDLDFEPPPGITFRRIDPETGDLATRHCPTEEVAAYVEGTEPLNGCAEHRGWWSRDDGDDTDAREERWQGQHRKRGLWSRIKDAIGA